VNHGLDAVAVWIEDECAVNTQVNMIDESAQVELHDVRLWV